MCDSWGAEINDRFQAGLKIFQFLKFSFLLNFKKLLQKITTKMFAKKDDRGGSMREQIKTKTKETKLKINSNKILNK